MCQPKNRPPTPKWLFSPFAPIPPKTAMNPDRKRNLLSTSHLSSPTSAPAPISAALRGPSWISAHRGSRIAHLSSGLPRRSPAEAGALAKEDTASSFVLPALRSQTKSDQVRPLKFMNPTQNRKIALSPVIPRGGDSLSPSAMGGEGRNRLPVGGFGPPGPKRGVLIPRSELRIPHSKVRHRASRIAHRASTNRAPRYPG